MPHIQAWPRPHLNLLKTNSADTHRRQHNCSRDVIRQNVFRRNVMQLSTASPPPFGGVQIIETFTQVDSLQKTF
jgi:hypothetical protein